MYGEIEIDKELIPYTFEILLNDELFVLGVGYNHTAGFFTVSLEKNGEVLCAGEPVVYGVPLFRDLVARGEFPDATITPKCHSGQYCTVTFDNLSSAVVLETKW